MLIPYFTYLANTKFAVNNTILKLVINLVAKNIVFSN